MVYQKSGFVKLTFGPAGSPPAILQKTDTPLFPNCQQKNRTIAPPPESMHSVWRNEMGTASRRAQCKLSLRRNPVSTEGEADGV